MTVSSTLLVVDDAPSFVFLIEGYLQDAGYQIKGVTSALEALEVVRDGGIDLVISDLMMPQMDGRELLRLLKREQSGLPVIIVTEHDSAVTAVQAIKEGADHYLLKPVEREELLVIVDRTLEQARVKRAWELQRDRDTRHHSFQNMRSASPTMVQALEQAAKVATSRATTVALLGESGTGKEMLAKAIHVANGLDLTRFVAVNCAAIPETLLESELFGHAKGAFTGAEQMREGKCALADGGTLFLDEIGDMPLSLQPKLLRLLEERKFSRVGSDTQLDARFRVMVATHQDLAELCRQGTFREDLFHRVMVFPIHLPPLRERKEDIPALVELHLDLHRHHLGKSLPGISRAAMTALMEYDWPGNVRELKNCLEYAVIMTQGELIRPEHLRIGWDAGGGATRGVCPDCLAENSACEGRLMDEGIHLDLHFSEGAFSLEAVNHQVMTWALQQCQYNKTAAAKLLKISRKAFYS
jgi:DNA-binding NtrC family response regulator